MMNWEKCISPVRYGAKGQYGPSADDRSQFEVDFDRIVFSSPFRRMQDKTQVIPLPESDFVHTRLTHSLEASCVGRSLGKIVGTRLLNERPALKDAFSAGDISAIVAAACLAHDIGNPPFGHSGENAIREYFHNGHGKGFEGDLPDQQWLDLAEFEGNANGFRILAGPNKGVPGGLRLTYTTLAAFTKYPCSSTGPTRETKGRASQKKNGFFYTENETFAEIADHLGLMQLADLSWARHPLAFLVEAADDITYRIVDFEDGARLGLISLNEAHALLLSLLKPDEKVEQRLREIPDPREKTSYLRAKVIFKLIYEAADAFLAREHAILAGEFDEPLIKHIPCAEELKVIHQLTIDRVYRSEAVLKIEATGFGVISNLLELFVKASNDLHYAREKGKHSFYRSAKLLDIFPRQFLEAPQQPFPDLYARLMAVCAYVSGMTDSYAMSTYRRLQGIEM